MKITRYINDEKIEGENMPKLNIVNTGLIQLFTDKQLKQNSNLAEQNVNDANE